MRELSSHSCSVLIKRAQILVHSHQSLNEMRADESEWELAVKREQEWQLSSSFDEGLNNPRGWVGGGLLSQEFWMMLEEYVYH